MRLFRKSYLTASREQDDLEVIVPRRHAPLFWPTVMTISLALSGLLIWMFVGSLPVVVKAPGVIMQVGGLREISPAADGLVKWSNAEIGQHIEAGELLFKTSSPNAEHAYFEAREKYETGIIALDQEATAIRVRYQGEIDRLEVNLNAQRALRAEVSAIQRSMGAAGRSYLKDKLDTLSQDYASASELMDEYGQFRNQLETLRADGTISQREFLRVLDQQAGINRNLSQTSISANQISLDKQRMDLELHGVKENMARLEASILKNLNDIMDSQNRMEVELAQLEARKLVLRQALLNAERALWYNQNVFSPYDGIFIAVNRGVGQAISANSTVALLNLVPQTQRMLLIISPRTAQGEITASLEERTVSVRFDEAGAEIRASRISEALKQLLQISDLDVSARGDDRFIISARTGDLERLLEASINRSELTDHHGLPVFSQLLPIGDDWSQGELINFAIVPESDLKRVKIGSRARIKPDTEKALIGTAIEGEVKRVGLFVQTAVEVEGLIGSSEVGRQLLGKNQGSVITLSLDKSASGELIWTDGAPGEPVTIGTTTKATIEIEASSPFQVIIPYIARFFEG